jgi:hypothetical protein
MKKVKVFFYLSLILLLISCAKSNSPVTLTQNLSMKIPLRDAYLHGYDIQTITATITKSAFIESTELTINDSIATGSFTELTPDTYDVEVSAYDSNNQLLAQGQSEVVIFAGQTTECHITLQFDQLTGDLDIIVHLDFPDQYDSVLFIGNSYTYYNDGINQHLEQMMHEHQNSDNFISNRVTYGGYTLEAHFNNETTISSIESGNWDLVILQEQSTRPIDNKKLMFDYATKLDSVIIENESETGFFMTWAREYDQTMIDSLSQAYIDIADSLTAELSPVGFAFKEVYDNTNIQLYAGDGSHPSDQGTYLATCMFFCLVTGESPENIEYNMSGEISNTERDQLQTIAWEVYQDHRVD